MTMPHERMRSLRWGSEVLKALEVDLFGEPHWVERATGIVRSYPPMDVLEHFVETPGASMPATFQSAINEARELFEDIFRNTRSSALRHDLQYTLRHFPSASIVKAIVNAATQGCLREWLCADRDD